MFVEDDEIVSCGLSNDENSFDDDVDDINHNSDGCATYNFEHVVDLAMIFAKSRSDIDFTKLYNVIKKRLYSHIKKIVGTNPDDVNTVLDNTMIVIYFNIDKYNPTKSKFHTWMYTIARNEAIDYMRREEIRNGNIVSTDFSDLYDSSILIDDNVYGDSTEPLSYVTEDEGFVDIVYDNKLNCTIYTKDLVVDTFFNLVDDAIEKLPSANQKILEERLFLNKKINDVAIVLGFNSRRVKRYYTNGKKFIREYIKDSNPHVYELIKEIY
jgi:RNA polymerase sigma factor (sigma-70 family)